jgi:hypothetical protein
VKRLGRRVEIAAAIVLLFPFLAAVVHELLRRSLPPFVGDYGLSEMNVRRALHARQLLGPYSRFGWAHPGPLYFYVIAPFYAVWEAEALRLVPTILATASVIATLALGAKRVIAPIHRAFGLVVLSVFVSAACVELSTSDPWNPFVTVYPFVAFFFLAAHVTDPDSRGLVWLALLHAFLCQTHVGNAPLATAILVAALFMRLRRARRARRDALVVASTMLLAWLPAIIEELIHRPGNLTALVRFFRTYPGLHPVLHTVGYSVERIVRFHLPGGSIRNGVNLVVWIEIVLVFCVLLGARKRRPAARFAALVAVALPAAFLAATRLRDEFMPHVTPLYPTLLPLAVFAIGWSLLPVPRSMGRPRTPVFALVALVPLVLLARRVHAIDVHRTSLDEVVAPDVDDARAFAAVLAPVLRDRHDVRMTTEGDAWATQVGVLLILDKQGIHPLTDPEWNFQLGDAYASPRTRVEIVIHEHPLPELVPILTGRHDSLSLRRPPFSLGKATIRASEGVTGDPGLAVDGVAPENAPFDAPTSVILSPKGSLTLDLRASDGSVREAQGLHVTADHNDTYRIEGSTDGETFRALGFLSMAPPKGMRTRDFYFRDPVSIVRISPGVGDGLYAISEIAPIYAPRGLDRIVFGDPRSRARLLEGFGGDEHDVDGPFVWATAKTARLELHLEEGRGCPIRLIASPFELPLSPETQTLTIESAGVHVATLSLSPETSIHSFDLPAKLAHARTEITFQFRYAKSPREIIPSSRDVRTLAAVFRVLEACPAALSADDLR